MIVLPVGVGLASSSRVSPIKIYINSEKAVKHSFPTTKDSLTMEMTPTTTEKITKLFYNNWLHIKMSGK